RALFFADVVAEVKGFYQPLDPGVTFDIGAPPADPHSFGFQWSLNRGPFAQFPAPAFARVKNFLRSNLSNLNKQQQAFVLGQQVSAARCQPGGHLGTLFLPTLAKPDV